MDGVLCDFHGDVEKLLHVKGKINYDLGSWDTVGKICEYLNISQTTFWNSHLSGTFWSMMNKTQECDTLIDYLEPYRDRTCILSSPANADSAAGKMIWLRNNLSDYYDNGQYLLGKAKDFCANKDSILIDDSDKNITRWKKEGGIGILYPRFWNSGHGISETDAMRGVLEQLLCVL